MSFLHVCLGILVAAVWGFNFTAIHIALKDLSPVLLCCIRFILTSFPALFFIKRPPVPFRMVIAYGLIMFALQFSLMFMGIKLGVAPGLASILLQTQAFFTILFAMILFKEKLSKWQVYGALISFSGIALAGFNLDGAITLAGFFFVMSAAICWGVGSVMVKKMGISNQTGLVIWASFIAWPPLLCVSWFLDGPDQIIRSLTTVSWPSVAAALYITYMSTCFGFIAWNWLLSLYPISSVAPFTLLVPIFGVASAALILGEPIYLWKIGSAILVISGLMLHLVGPRISKKIFQENKEIV